MYIIPFLSRQYEANLKKEDLLQRIQKLGSPADWNITLEKSINNRVLECTVTNDSFLIVKGRYGLTWGKTSALPVMAGMINWDEQKQKSIVRIYIRPYIAGILIRAPFYCIALYGLIKGYRTNDINLVIFCLIFLSLIYGSVISKFNKECKGYLELMEKLLRQGSF